MNESIKDKIFREQLDSFQAVCKAILDGAFPEGSPEHQLAIMIQSGLAMYEEQKKQVSLL